jgi:tRNA dimethylallyltransferase
MKALLSALSAPGGAAQAKVICLVGPTASGKTAAALALARELPIEIISMDSALVYRQMDIGTAKPDAAELAQAPHHLIDVIDPAQSYSAAQFCSDALALIGEIRARGRTPLIVGGTMMYYKALCSGLNDMPAADPAVRAELEAEAVRDGWPALHARLALVDPLTAARLAPQDAQRIQRALEVWMISGQALSAWHAAAPPAAQAARYQFIPVALEPSERSVLHQRIAERFDIMLARGLVEEVAQLRARGDLHPGLPSIRCVGYRQIWEYLDGTVDLATARDKGIFATRQLCKRQLTWLRSLEHRHVIDCNQTDATAQAVSAMQRLLAN